MQLWRTSPPQRPAESWPSIPEATRVYSHPEPPPVSRPPQPRTHPPWYHFVLFMVTLLSMTAAGAMQRGVNPLAGPAALVHLIEGLPFAATLLTILAVHEFGHYYAARRWHVSATLPYFIPLPFVSFLGTLGAVIKIRSAIPHKRALLDIGTAGPLAGFVLASGACLVGLAQSQVVDPAYFDPYPPIRLGTPLLFAAFARLVAPVAGPDQIVLLSPVAFAGWVGLFITAFNLFPVGQLDGGHVVYALFGQAHRYIARTFYAILLVMGIYGILSMVWNLPPEWPQGWPGWLVLALLLTILGRDHPPPYFGHIPLNRSRRVIGYLSLLVFILCFTPVPFSYSIP